MHNTFFRLFAVCAIGGLCAADSAALPVPGYVYPCSQQVGTTARITVGGMFMRNVHGAIVSGDGVKVTRVVQVPGFPRATGKTQIPWLKEWFYDILAGDDSKRDLPPEATDEHTDWHECDWWERLNEHDDLERQIICRFWHTPENYPQPTPALDQLVILDVEIDANAKPGMRELMVFDHSSISAPHPFLVTKEPHVSEPSFVIPTNDLRNVSLPHILHLPPNLPVQNPPVTIDGQAWPGEVDTFRIRLAKGKRYTFEMFAREFMPYQGDAVPGFFNPVMRLFSPSGKEIAFEDDFYFLPDPILSIVVPEDGIYTLKVHDNLYRGRQDNVYAIRCYEDAINGHSHTPQSRAFVCFPPPASHLPPAPSDDFDVRTGTIDCPGRSVRHDFKVTGPITLNFELFARRNGSPLDGVIKLYGPMRKGVPLSSTPLLAQWDDADKFLAGTIPQAICDPVGSWTFLDPGDFCLTVTDQSGEGGDGYDYSLCISKFLPTFDVYAEQSSVLMNGDNGSIKIKVVRRNGFTGPVTIESNGDFNCDYTFDGDVTSERVPITAKKSDWTGLKQVQFFASAQVGASKKSVTKRITPADPAEQAFAYTHLVPQRTFFIYRP